MIVSLEQLSHNQRKRPDGNWGPAKPVGVTILDRIRGAWEVLRGRAAAVRWD